MINNLQIKQAGSQDRDSLNYILQNSEHSSIFHTESWNELLSKEFGLKRKTFIAYISGTPVGMHTVFVRPAHSITSGRQSSRLINIVESPLRNADSIYGGPIVIEPISSNTNSVDTNDEYLFVVQMLIRAGEKVDNRLEFYQICTPPNYPVDFIQKCGYKCEKHWTSVIKVNRTEDEIWNSFHSKRRNLIRKAYKNGVTIVIDDFNFIHSYYQMVKETFRGKTGAPFPYTYYERIIKTLTYKTEVRIPSADTILAKFLIARCRGRTIAGGIFLCFKDTVYYWSGTSCREFHWLAPNDLIQWEIIKWAHRNWYKYYDLLVVDTAHLPGIAHFKLGFGGELKEIYSARKYTGIGKLIKFVRRARQIRTLVVK